MCGRPQSGDKTTEGKRGVIPAGKKMPSEPNKRWSPTPNKQHSRTDLCSGSRTANEAGNTILLYVRRGSRSGSSCLGAPSTPPPQNSGYTPTQEGTWPSAPAPHWTLWLWRVFPALVGALVWVLCPNHQCSLGRQRGAAQGCCHSTGLGDCKGSRSPLRGRTPEQSQAFL